MTEKLDYKKLRHMVQDLSRVAGFIQFSGSENPAVALKKCTDVIQILNIEVDRQIEEIVKKHEHN